MQKSPSDLPSKGYLVPGKSAPSFNIRPYTFLELVNYLERETNSNAVKSLIKDIDHLKLIDPNILKQSLFDLDWLIFHMKVYTISESLTIKSEITCPICSERNNLSIDINDFEFQVIDRQESIRKVILGGKAFTIEVPTIETFYGILQKYSMYEKVMNVDIIKLISLIKDFDTIPNIVESAVLNSTREDIVKLHYLESNLLSSVKPKYIKCSNKNCSNHKSERGMVVRIESLITNLFLSLILNNESSINEDEFK